MDFDNITCVRIAGSCAEVLVSVGFARTATSDHDTISASIPQVFDAKKSNQSDIQVSVSHRNRL